MFKKHKWKPLNTHVAGGVLYAVEYCEKTGMYRYVRIPSFKELDEIEKGAE